MFFSTFDPDRQPASQPQTYFISYDPPYSRGNILQCIDKILVLDSHYDAI
jgi:hypothetical protein